jgi:hypothetical protein
MKKTTAWSVSGMDWYGLRIFAGLFSLTLILLFYIPTVHARQTFHIDNETDYYCSDVQWSEKSHEYVGFKTKATHKYLFRGTWPQLVCEAGSGSNCWYRNWAIEVSGIYNEETDIFSENVSFRLGTWKIEFLTNGQSTLDPWLAPTWAISDFTAQCIRNELNGASVGVVPYPEIPPIFFTRCVFSATERSALEKEEPVTASCTENQIKAKPTVVTPTPSQFFGDYNDAYVAVEMPCLPLNPDSSENGFHYILEEKIVEKNGDEYWLPMCNPCSIEMDPSEYHYVTKGLKKLTLERAGKYRIKLNQQVRTGTNLVASDYTDWINFSAGFGMPAVAQQGKTAIQIHTPPSVNLAPVKPLATSANKLVVQQTGAINPVGNPPIQQPSAPAPGAVKLGGATPAQTPGAVSSAGAVLGGAGCSVNVTGPAANQTCYVKGTCPVTWDTSKIKNYGSVFLHVVQIDAQHPQGWEGGGFPVPNNGSYQWVVPENVGPLTGATYQIKVVTPDQKCSGKSKPFNIKNKLMQTPAQKPVLLKK